MSYFALDTNVKTKTKTKKIRSEPLPIVRSSWKNGFRSFGGLYTRDPSTSVNIFNFSKFTTNK